MRKVLIVLGCLVVIALLATPLIGGLLARRAYDVLVENFDQVEIATAGAVRVTNEGFELGWLSSKARMRVEVGAAGLPIQFTLAHVIHHGPLPIARVTRGPSMAVIDTTVEGATAANGAEAFVGETVIGMTGDLGVDLTSLALPPRDEVEWEGGSAKLRVGGQGTRVAAQVSAPRFELRGSSGELSLQSLKVDYTSERESDGPSTGSATYAIDRARLASPGDRLAEIDGFSWKSSTAYNAEGRLDASAALRLAALDVDDQSYRDVAFDVSLRNLDENAVQALEDLRSRLTGVTGSGQTPQDMAASLQSALVMQMPKILSSAPEAEIKGARVQTLDGRIELDLRVQVDPTAVPDVSAPAGAQPLKIEGRVVVPFPVFEGFTKRAAAEINPTAVRENDTASLEIMADQIAEVFLRQGFFSEESDGRLASDIAFRGNQLELNGRPVVLTDLLMQSAGAPQ